MQGLLDSPGPRTSSGHSSRMMAKEWTSGVGLFQNVSHSWWRHLASLWGTTLSHSQVMRPGGLISAGWEGMGASDGQSLSQDSVPSLKAASGGGISLSVRVRDILGRKSGNVGWRSLRPVTRSFMLWVLTGLCI